MKTPRSVRESHWVSWDVLFRWAKKSTECEEEIVREMLDTYIEHGTITRMQRNGVYQYKLPEVVFQ